MGALISTVGTRYLVSHLNRTFSKPRIGHVRADASIGDPSGTGQPIQYYFSPAASAAIANLDLHWISHRLRHAVSARGDQKLFLPEDVARSSNVVDRWSYFLTQANPNVLTAANHTAIITAIYRALNTTAGGVPTYDRIEFDCVDSGQVGGAAAAQTVLSSDEHDDRGTLYMKIVLVTPPMADNRNGAIANLPALDPQPYE